MGFLFFFARIHGVNVRYFPPQSEKKTLLVPSRDWVVVEAGVVPSYRLSPPFALLLRAVAFWSEEPPRGA